MKANEFVKNNPWLLKNGAKDLKDIIIDAKEYKYLCLSNLCHSYANHSAGVSIAISDLKHLVESYELVKSHGGLDKAKYALENPMIDASEAWDLKQAIADMESCQ